MNKTTFLTQCPYCGQKFEAQVEWKGIETVCPSCNSKFTITEKQIFVANAQKHNKFLAFGQAITDASIGVLRGLIKSDAFQAFLRKYKEYKITILVLILSFFVSGSICLIQDNIIIISKTKDIERIVSVYGGFPPKIKYLILDNVKSFFRGFYFAYNIKEEEYVWKFFYRYGGSKQVDFYMKIYEQNVNAMVIQRRNELLKGY